MSKRRARSRWDDLKWWALGVLIATLAVIWGVAWVSSWGRL
jgi:hypothetical protein